MATFLTEGLELNLLDSTEPDLMDDHCIPDHIELSTQVKVCLQECDFDTTESNNFMELFDTTLYSVDLSKWAKAIQSVKKKPAYITRSTILIFANM